MMQYYGHATFVRQICARRRFSTDAWRAMTLSPADSHGIGETPANGLVAVVLWRSEPVADDSAHSKLILCWSIRTMTKFSCRVFDGTAKVE
jgi:hypothetical protein